MVVLIMKAKVAVCSLLLCGAAACAALQVAEAPSEVAPDAPPPDRVVHMTAERFLFTPSQITIEAGTVLEIRITSEDTDHGFRIAGPNGVEVVVPKRGRGEAVARFTPTELGEYRFVCSRICGAGHNYMRGVIRVTAANDATREADPR